LILNKGDEEQIHEYEDMEQALNAAIPWIMKGYIARIADAQGVIKYTQALSGGSIAMYTGDATSKRPASGVQAISKGTMVSQRNPWWQFWR
jgi:hypothetical protein